MRRSRSALATDQSCVKLPAVNDAMPGEFMVGELLQGDDTVAVVAKLRFQMHVWTRASPKAWMHFTNRRRW